MSPSRRRAIGAVRGLASRVIAVSRCRAHHPGGAMVGRNRPWGLPTARWGSPQNRCCKTNYFLLHYHR